MGDRAERSRETRAGCTDYFTEITGDTNPLLYREAAAGATLFGEPVVQGGVASGVLNTVVAEDLPGPGTVFMSVNRDLTAPVRPNDTVTGVVEVTAVREDELITELQT